MVDAGPNICRTGGDVDDGGDCAWSYPTSINADDDSYSSVSLANGDTSHLLIAYNFGFAIPSKAIIANLAFTYQHHTNGITFSENVIKIRDSAGALAGNNKASGNWGTSVADTTRSGNATYWGVTLTPTLINSTNFGLAIKLSYSGSHKTAGVDYVSCTAAYTLPFSVGLIGKGLCGASPLISQTLTGRMVS